MLCMLLQIVEPIKVPANDYWREKNEEKNTNIYTNRIPNGIPFMQIIKLKIVF